MPAGAATSANQATEIASLASIDSKTPALGQATMANSSPVVIASDQSHIPTNIFTSSGANLTAAGVAGALDVFINNTSVPVRGNGINGSAVTANTLLVSGDNSGTQRNIAVSAAGHILTDSSISGPVSVTQGTTPWVVDGSAVTQPVSAASLPLPTGASTSANQTTEIAAINSFAGKTAAGFVPEAFDETDLTYVGATDAIDTVTYKLLGSTVATLTFSYDGSNRLSTVVKT